jgi:beta-lactamase superfamily II metal-dependent hydrolase
MAEPIRIRVYNVGFGDCILLHIPTPTGRVAKVLVDCGSLSFGETGQNNESVVERVIGDVTEDGRPKIDVVVASHRHKDHISGFGLPQWRSVEVGEVWQPWTENPNDPEARRLFDAQMKLALAISGSETHLREMESEGTIGMEAKDLILDMAVNALSNEDSIKTLRVGFGSSPQRRWLSRRTRPRKPAVLDGLPVHVLGPSKDPEVIRSLDPPKGQSYLAMVGAPDPDDPKDDPRPFPHLATDMNWKAFSKYGGTPRPLNAGQAIGVLKKLTEGEAVLAAAALDHALNNTSLMLMFEVGDHFLLFPGDSQWGTWKLALGTDWSRDLLARTTFYKVGHHGSHNATPTEFVEEVLAPGSWCVASVTPYPRWKQVPKEELIKRMSDRSPDHVFTTMSPPESPPPEVSVVDGGAAIDFELSMD